MKAVTFTAPGEAQIIDREPPVASAEMTLVAPHFVGLCGTDLELYNGSMPYFAQGVASYPIQPGHEMAGVVVESGDPGLAPGTRVMADPVVGCGKCSSCQAGRQTHCVDRYEMGIRRGMPGAACELVAIPTRNLHRVPDNVTLDDAVLVEPGVTASHAVSRLGDAKGRRALVLGGGTLGLIAAQLLLSAGASTDVLDPVVDRHPLIEEINAVPVTEAAESRYHLVVEAAGAAQAIHDALTAVAPGGKIALIGVQPAPVDQVDINQLVLKDATIDGILSGPGLFDQLLREIADGLVDPAKLVDSHFPFAEAQAALARLTEPSRTRPKVLLHIDSSL